MTENMKSNLWFRKTYRGLIDAVIFNLVTLSMLFFSDIDNSVFITHKYYVSLLLSLIYISINNLLRLYSFNFKHITGEVAIKLLASNLLIFLISRLFLSTPSWVEFLSLQGIFFNVYVITILVKFSYRFYDRFLQSHGAPILVYGAGRAGRQFANAIFHSKAYKVVGFLDDDISKQGDVILGHKVYSKNELKHILKAKKIQGIVLALPRISETSLSDLYEQISKSGIQVFSLPSFEKLLSGEEKISDMRTIKPEEVLGRDRISPDVTLMRKVIKNKIILVTGGGGSIGSELCEIIANQSPKKVVILESNEFALFKICQRLNTLNAAYNPTIVPVLGSILDINLLNEIFEEHAIDSVFHAAAYKHVPLVEENIISGIENNIFGTRKLLNVATKYDCENFTLISTDKAVRPTNVMGATKRISEMLCQMTAKDPKNKMSICIVRFGNVLGSSGSVIPIFNEQIKNGGPVTVTHKEVTRYFMTVQEAAELVIQASAFAKKAEIFLLDMGEPVKIYDLAKRLIELNGKIPVLTDAEANADEFRFKDQITIVEVGLRKGEKLYEELLVDGSAEATNHPKIWLARETGAQANCITEFLQQLEVDLEMRDLPGILHTLQAMPIEYQSQS